MSASLRDLKVWQEAVALAADVLRAARRSARREVKVVTDELMATAVAVAAHIAEGSGQHDPAGQRVRYQAALEALLRLETLLAVVAQGGLIDEVTLAPLSRRATAVARLLGGFLVYLDRQLETQGLGTRD